ncbi:MAG: hypothetical protein ACREMY_13755, partial [bacterium]
MTRAAIGATATRRAGATSALTLFALILPPTSAGAQTPDSLSSPSELKRLSLEQLMDVEVISV